MRQLIGSILLALSLPLLVAAQDARDSWDNLKTLRPGQMIEVVDMDWKSVKGTFVSYADDGISIQTGSGPLTIERPNVLRVSLREHSKRLRNALLGAGIGAAALGVPVAIFAYSYGDFSESQAGAASALGFALGAGAGGGIGAAIPSYETVYRVRKPTKRSAP